MERNPAVARALRWLTASGIQEEGPRGGALWSGRGTGAAWRYSEVTGYGITLLCDLARRGLLPDALPRAARAAGWLFGRARRGGPFACRQVADGTWVEHLCTFDNGMILQGFCALYEADGDGRWLQAARGAMAFLLACRRPDGLLAAKMDGRTGQPLPEARWSGRPGACQAKVGLGLLHLHRLDPDPRLPEAARGLCRAVLAFQQPDGRFVTDAAAGDTYLHAHAYALEGLAGCGALLGTGEFDDAVDRGLDWIRAAVREHGFLPATHDGRAFGTAEHADSTAQALRLLALRGDRGAESRVLAARLAALQHEGPDPARDGAFRYAREGGQDPGQATTHGTLFAVQALLLRDDPDPAGTDWGLWV